MSFFGKMELRKCGSGSGMRVGVGGNKGRGETGRKNREMGGGKGDEKSNNEVLRRAEHLTTKIRKNKKEKKNGKQGKIWSDLNRISERGGGMN
jgi:hypothetical protein